MEDYIRPFLSCDQFMAGITRRKASYIGFEYRALIPWAKSLVNVGIDAAGGDVPP